MAEVPQTAQNSNVYQTFPHHAAINVVLEKLPGPFLITTVTAKRTGNKEDEQTKTHQGFVDERIASDSEHHSTSVAFSISILTLVLVLVLILLWCGQADATRRKRSAREHGQGTHPHFSGMIQSNSYGTLAQIAVLSGVGTSVPTLLHSCAPRWEAGHYG